MARETQFQSQECENGFCDLCAYHLFPSLVIPGRGVQECSLKGGFLIPSVQGTSIFKILATKWSQDGLLTY